MEQGSLIKEFTQTEIVPTRIPRISMKYTTSATLHVGNVDDGITLSQLDGPTTEKTGDNSCEMVAQSQSRPLNTKYLISGSSIFNRGPIEDKVVSLLFLYFTLSFLVFKRLPLNVKYDSLLTGAYPPSLSCSSLFFIFFHNHLCIDVLT